MTAWEARDRCAGADRLGAWGVEVFAATILELSRRSEGCTNSIRSCCRLIVFVQQPAKSISPTHRCVNRKRRPLELFLLCNFKHQSTVRSLSVVMMNVDLEDAPEVASGVDEQPVQALCRQVVPARRGAGPRPRRASSFLIAVANTLIPSFKSSPRMRLYPHLGARYGSAT
jgi:hypothetical protein